MFAVEWLSKACYDFQLPNIPSLIHTYERMCHVLLLLRVPLFIAVRGRWRFVFFVNAYIYFWIGWLTVFILLLMIVMMNISWPFLAFDWEVVESCSRATLQSFIFFESRQRMSLLSSSLFPFLLMLPSLLFHCSFGVLWSFSFWQSHSRWLVWARAHISYTHTHNLCARIIPMHGYS